MHGAPFDAIGTTMSSGAVDRAELVRILRRWLLPIVDGLDDTGRLVNEACRIAEQEASVVRAVDLAARVHVSPRTLERVVRRTVGMTPKWLIECRRLQEAATRLYSEPGTDLSDLAVELGYADHAHFSRQYKRILGETPEDTRREGRALADRRPD
jgi:methylphosphotriester-DNA--protein-cysteine methyltransferase